MRRLLFLLFLIPLNLFSQTFRFAQVTDTHVGGATGADDLRRTVLDLNQQQGIDFVILSGDVTEFGSDEELALAKQILDSLNLPLYVIPGNHDSNWSESGANSFRKVFGAETFFFEHNGVQFIGTTSGPNMRMSPGQVPRENLVWMDSIFEANPDQDKPLIAINHYPLDSSLNNWYENIDRIKTKNVQLALCGHGHINKLYDWEGIPGVMARSNLRAKDAVGGYNIITVSSDSVFFRVRRPLMITEDYWLKLPLKRVSPDAAQGVKRPNYALNANSQAKVVWEFEDHGDIGAGITADKKWMYTANTVGEVYALDLKTGKQQWTFKTGGKVYSTPAVHKGVVVVGSSDHFIYGIHAKTGKELWKLEADKAVLGSPAVKNGKAYIGASDGIFRCIDVKTGKLIWSYKDVQGYVSTLPTLADNKVIFGSWKNGFYALDQKTGQLVWKWDNGHSNRMFSAAACYPVVENNRVFIVAPDRFMTAIDLKTGQTIWREKKDEYRVRESMGISRDRKLVLAKTMDGELIGVPVNADKMDVNWKAEIKLPYELAPTAIYTNAKYIFVPSDKGLLSAVEPKTGKTAWQYKISNGMINPPLVLKDRVVVSTMDGKIVMLTY
ncbi:outer membrane protein assembly factor BamB family protein [Sphingobacterium mizutaii]|uniref:outer membrane protein assembly factor BamB family protein n=1 Tax=Sphingobacterium mizutaii TaxID=1010 RepID=UPI002898CF86|nr:PQQ-binding-like beta-propeller repeat protein [Sphingobacterium mizutaii]